MYREEDMRPAIEISGLSKVYHQRRGVDFIAVDNLSLSVPPGQVFGFLGANGAGKTTTIKMLCGLIIPSSGRLRINGYDVQRERSLAMRQIGAVLEGTRNVYWRLSAWQNLLYFGRLKGCPGKEVRSRAERLLRELDLWEQRDMNLRFFSRGMQQKVAIACALIADPSIVLLDEPTLGLDVQAAHTLKTWIMNLAHEQGKTVILTTHQLDIAQELCQRVAIMRRGRLLTSQTLSDLLSLFREEHYHIRVQGRHRQAVMEACSDFEVTEEDGSTLLSGAVERQEELYVLLERLRHQGFALLDVHRVEPDLEQVFLRLMEKEENHVAVHA
ncbi:ABC transporter ATP-binding protein [Ktedonospora formicarum]|uniref:Daunorubicin resistance protein DrrA family ABC transporter ATP-binding protein n=1 Tax=Ktedonospora formicarum TaxID=2778364 RepID=A0A8J3MR00_9CHLR|nr:ABC transporter ATP-binding protein [Ktedonospora formicarum]GHO43153.1 daunorubicin resistance protein DrrA family ABC transporter ATP-binding protein [Ktedonospora formicarum]